LGTPIIVAKRIAQGLCFRLHMDQCPWITQTHLLVKWDFATELQQFARCIFWCYQLFFWVSPGTKCRDRTNRPLLFWDGISNCTNLFRTTHADPR